MAHSKEEAIGRFIEEVTKRPRSVDPLGCYDDKSGLTCARTVGCGCCSADIGNLSPYIDDITLDEQNELIAIWLEARGFNLFLGLDPYTIQIPPVFIPLDAVGEGLFTFPHDGSLLGLVAIQALVLESDGQVAAISKAAFL